MAAARAPHPQKVGRALACIALMTTGLCGCGHQPPAGTTRAVPSAARAWPPLQWPSVPNVQRYVVRGWSGDRLLFELSTSDTVLALDPSSQRAAAAFDSASVEVVAEGASGIRVTRWLKLP